jgi:ATP-dependent Zn protease
MVLRPRRKLGRNVERHAHRLHDVLDAALCRHDAFDPAAALDALDHRGLPERLEHLRRLPAKHFLPAAILAQRPYGLRQPMRRG